MRGEETKDEQNFLASRRRKVESVRESENAFKSGKNRKVHCKKQKKESVMEEEVQALVVDNGSGMCKAGEFSSLHAAQTQGKKAKKTIIKQKNRK
jgi:hypothetical protein